MSRSKLISKCTISVVLYALFAAYFAGVMVRLILTLTPVVCVLSAIAFSSLFELYLKDDENPQADQSGKNDNLYDEVCFLLLKLLKIAYI